MPIHGLKWGNMSPAPSPISARAIGTPYLAPVPDEDDDDRDSWVETVRQAVESGEYKVDSLLVAERLLEQGVLDDDDA